MSFSAEGMSWGRKSTTQEDVRRMKRFLIKGGDGDGGGGGGSGYDDESFGLHDSEYTWQLQVVSI